MDKIRISKFWAEKLWKANAPNLVNKVIYRIDHGFEMKTRGEAESISSRNPWSILFRPCKTYTLRSYYRYGMPLHTFWIFLTGILLLSCLCFNITPGIYVYSCCTYNRLTEKCCLFFSFFNRPHFLSIWSAFQWVLHTALIFFYSHARHHIRQNKKHRYYLWCSINESIMEESVIPKS